MLVREWDGQLHRVMVLADGFAWNDKSLPQSIQGGLCHDRHTLERPQILRPA